MIRESEPRSGRLERRLAELSRRRAELAARAGAPESPTPYDGAGRGRGPAGSIEPGGGQEGGDRIEAVPLEEVIAGRPIRTPHGVVFLHEQLRSQIEVPRTEWGRLEAGGRRRRPSRPAWQLEPGTEPSGRPERGRDPWEAGEPEERTWRNGEEVFPSLGVLHAELEALRRLGLGSALFLDLETCGLAQSTVFLAGTMRWTGSDFVLHQFLARDYSEEAALLHAVAEEVAAAETIITFNGKAFDLPLLRDRATALRQAFPVPSGHVDLLHHARARWRGELPDCRLGTLEAWICGRRRSGDVPGSEIPSLYHHFVRSGDPYRLIPLLHHNLLDVISMEELLRALID